MKYLYLLIITLKSTFFFSQEIDDFSKRLKAINNQSIVFYNIDGVDFSSQIFSKIINRSEERRVGKEC